MRLLLLLWVCFLELINIYIPFMQRYYGENFTDVEQRKNVT